ncbi:hypothetical protein GCM10007285_33070 [Stappia taiwanensis]|nr:hypothetical protein GCM10007285_33070 [Stappia taiwanensis]
MSAGGQSLDASWWRFADHARDLMASSARGCDADRSRDVCGIANMARDDILLDYRHAL